MPRYPNDKIFRKQEEEQKEMIKVSSNQNGKKLIKRAQSEIVILNKKFEITNV